MTLAIPIEPISAPDAQQPVSSERRHEARDAALAWTRVLPQLAGITLFLIGPTIATFTLAFTDWQMGARAASFAGLNNLVELFGDRDFQRSAINTALYCLVVTPGSVLLGLWLALKVESLTWGRALFRAAFFLPVVSTAVAMAVVWEFLLHPTLGPVNGLLAGLGLARQNFLGDAATALPTLMAIGIWQNTGYSMVLIIAGLKAIPAELYEAAAIEGADRPYERFFTVSLPLLGPTLVFVVVVSFLNSFRVFDTVAALTQGGPRHASDVLLFTIYQEGFVFFRVGYASALTLVFVLVLLLLTLVQVRLLDKRVHYQ